MFSFGPVMVRLVFRGRVRQFRPWLLSFGTSWTGCSTLLASLPPEPLHAHFHQLWFPLDFPVLLFHHLILFLSTRAPTRSQTNNLSPGMPRSGAGDGISGTPGGRTPGPLRFSLREERFLVRCCSSDAAPLGSQRKETGWPGGPAASALRSRRRQAPLGGSHSAPSFETKTAPEEKAPERPASSPVPPDPGPVGLRCIPPAPRRLATAALHAPTCVAESPVTLGGNCVDCHWG